MQNKTHLGVLGVFFLSDPPAVIVIAEMILQDVRERKRSRLIWVFTLFKCPISMLIFNIYNETEHSCRQEPKLGLKVCLFGFTVSF